MSRSTSSAAWLMADPLLESCVSIKNSIRRYNCLKGRPLRLQIVRLRGYVDGEEGNMELVVERG